MKKTLFFLSVTIFFVSFSACNDDVADEIPALPEFLVLPKHFPTPVFDNLKNPITKEGFELGKMLFYDPILSKDSTISCGSCHFSEFAFSDRNLPLSFGVNGTKGERNSPPLFNLQWHKNFMWDGGVNHMELIALAPIENPLEMKETIRNVMDKLNKNKRYRAEFKKVFKVDSITDLEFFYAITQFQSALISANSKYDKVKKGTAKFNQNEQNGYLLFQKHCDQCHSEPLFSNFLFEKNGMAKGNDFGRYLITLNDADSFKFKVPTLRNLWVTAPYMHDGSIATMEDVIEHYSENVLPNNNELLPKPLKFTKTEKDDLLAFLMSLSDYSFVNDSRFK